MLMQETQYFDSSCNNLVLCLVVTKCSKLKFECNVADSQLCTVVYRERCRGCSDACCIGLEKGQSTCLSELL
jgi:hypothetical protein